MHLSVAETATVLNKTSRQIRYMIKQGQIKAVRQGKSWRIESDSLPLSESTKRALKKRLSAVRETVDAALEPVAKALGKTDDPAASSEGTPETTERYSVRKLIAFEIACDLYRQLLGVEPPAELAEAALLEAILQLTQGCHAYRAEEKAVHFREARRQAATATAHLYLGGGEARGAELAGRLEQELIPKIGGLVAAQEKGRKKSSRFDRFGTKPRRESA